MTVTRTTMEDGGAVWSGLLVPTHLRLSGIRAGVARL